MVTKFGDLYDHISDLVSNGIMIVLLVKTQFRYKIFWSGLLLSLFTTSMIHMGCQEKIYKKKSVLTILQKLCPNQRYMIYTKFIGCGTFMFVFSLLIFNLGYFTK